MKALNRGRRIFALVALVVVIALSSVWQARAVSKCTGATPCNACSTCSSCRHCNSGGGTCGVCAGGPDAGGSSRTKYFYWGGAAVACASVLASYALRMKSKSKQEKP